MSMSLRPYIYVSGPYSSNPEWNTDRAIDVADQIWEVGGCPFLPHFTHFWDKRHPKPYETWMDYDGHWLPLCDALYRVPGESPGADREVQEAFDMGMPVLTDMKILRAWVKSYQETRPTGRLLVEGLFKIHQDLNKGGQSHE